VKNLVAPVGFVGFAFGTESPAVEPTASRRQSHWLAEEFDAVAREVIVDCTEQGQFDTFVGELFEQGSVVEQVAVEQVAAE